MTVARHRLRSGSGASGARLRAIGAGIAAVATKELRGRMRGRRAFAVLTIYLVLLGLFAYGIYEFQKRTLSSFAVHAVGAPAFDGLGGIEPGADFASPFPPAFGQAPAMGAIIGQSIFAGLLVLETLLVLVLAPAFTSGAISLEREKQTLELLVTTPLSSLAMILGKLFSALVYIFLLIVASIPFASLVFAFGGVGPEDLVRAYVFLFALAFGMGAIGLFISALVRRTQVATVLTYVTVLALTLGTSAVYVFWTSVSAPADSFGAARDRARGGPPEALVWLNPFVANADLICGTASSGYDGTCAVVATVTGKPYFHAREEFGGGAAAGAEVFAVDVPALKGPPPAVPDEEGAQREWMAGRASSVRCDESGCHAVAADVAAAAHDPLTSGFPRDTLWPRSAAAFLVTGAVLTLLSTQLVSPTRRVRVLRLGRRPRPARPASPRPTATETLP